MRISSRSIQTQWLAAFRRQQAEVAATQRAVASGKRITTARDDPAGAAQSVRLDAALARLTSYAGNAETARRRLALGEDALDKVTGALDRARELAVQAGSGALSPANRAAIGGELAELLRGVLANANAQDGEGRFLFGGGVVKAAPFAGSGAAVAYLGDDTTRSQLVADQRTVAENDPGSRAFMNIRDGNGVFSVGAAPANTGTAWFAGAAVTDRSQWVAGDYRVEFTAPGSYQVRDAGGALVAGGAYTPGTPIAFRGVAVTIDGAPAAGDRFEVSESRNQSIFASLQELVDALALDATQPAGRARLQSALNAGLDNLDQALDNIARVRSDVGTRLAAIESQQDVNADLELDLSQSLSDLRDVDLAAAVSALEQQLAALEAAQKSFARTQSLSLFDLI